VSEKPWVARTWAGSRLLTEARYAQPWEAQDALTELAQRGTGLTRVSVDYEPEVTAAREGEK
jgi:predicted peptidase